MKYVSLCECTQKLKVLFSCVVIKLRVLFTSWFACTHCAENYLFAKFVSLCECTQKIKVLFSCFGHKIKTALYELVCLYSLCRKLPFRDFFVIFWVQAKTQVLFLCVVVKVRVFFRSCCHRFVCTRCAENEFLGILLSFCEYTQKLKVLFLCVWS